MKELSPRSSKVRGERTCSAFKSIKNLDCDLMGKASRKG